VKNLLKHQAVVPLLKGKQIAGCSGSPTFCSAADLVITTLNQICLSHRQRIGPAD
jgi:hypothetical protein